MVSADAFGEASVIPIQTSLKVVKEQMHARDVGLPTLAQISQLHQTQMVASTNAKMPMEGDTTSAIREEVQEEAESEGTKPKNPKARGLIELDERELSRPKTDPGSAELADRESHTSSTDPDFLAPGSGCDYHGHYTFLQALETARKETENWKAKAGEYEGQLEETRNDFEQTKARMLALDDETEILTREIEELTKTNRDLTKTNQDLTMANRDLTESNQHFTESNRHLTKTNQVLTKTNRDLTESNEHLTKTILDLIKSSEGDIKTNRDLLNQIAQLRNLVEELKKDNSKSSGTASQSPDEKKLRRRASKPSLKERVDKEKERGAYKTTSTMAQPNIDRFGAEPLNEGWAGEVHAAKSLTDYDAGLRASMSAVSTDSLSILRRLPSHDQ